MLLTATLHLLLWPAAALRAEDQPRIEFDAVLPVAMKKALVDHDPKFQVRAQGDFFPPIISEYRFSSAQAPATVVGDFNGDKALDAVLMGHNERSDLLIALLSQGKSFKVVEVAKLPLSDPKTLWNEMGKASGYGLSAFLTLVPRSKVTSPHEGRSLDLETDGFELNYYGKAAVLYYLGKEGRFLTYVTGD